MGALTHAIVLQANPFPYLAGFKTVGSPELKSSTGAYVSAYSTPVLAGVSMTIVEPAGGQ